MAFEYDYSVPELAKRYSVHEVTIVDWIKKGTLKADIFPGRRPKYRIPESEVARFERERLIPASERKLKKSYTKSDPVNVPVTIDKPTPDLTLGQLVSALERIGEAIRKHPELTELIIECAKES